MTDTILVPALERTVDFYGDAIPVAQTADGHVYVALSPLAEFLGLDAKAQRRRAQRDPVMAARSRTVKMTAPDGKVRDSYALPLDLLPGWLFGITTAKVNPELAEKLNRYRAECFLVLWNAFKGQIVPMHPPAADLSGAALALEIATAVQALARQQLEMEGKLDQVADKQQVIADYMRRFVKDTHSRLSYLEMRLGEGAAISEKQKAEIALAVRNIGKALEARGQKGGYQVVYAEMYRRYAISAYENLPREKFDEAIVWLHEWYTELTSNQQRV